jgi:hypothetical protein
MDSSIAWAEPDDTQENDEPPEEQSSDADVEDLATRRLRRWLGGMFGGDPTEPKG